VKTAGEAFVVVGIEVGIEVDIIIMLLLLEPIIIVLLMLMPLLVVVVVVEPNKAAAAWYASSVLFEPATSLMTMDMPFWQWPV
jgi:hypothetical protein